MNAAGFNIADVVALLVVLVCAALGFKRGLVGQIMPLITIAVVALCVRFGYAPCRQWMAAHTGMDDAVVRLGSFVLVIVVPLATMILLSQLFRSIARFPILSGIDRIGGAISGLIGGIVLVLVVFLILAVLPQRYRPAVTGDASSIGRFVSGFERDVIGIVSQRVDRTEGVIMKARQERTGKREKWEE